MPVAASPAAGAGPVSFVRLRVRRESRTRCAPVPSATWMAMRRRRCGAVRDRICLISERGRNQNHAGCTPRGKKVNRSAYGATVEFAAGIIESRLTTGVRTLWPGRTHERRCRRCVANGIAQNVIRPPSIRCSRLRSMSRRRLRARSFTRHNGARWELVNEILGIGRSVRRWGGCVLSGRLYGADEDRADSSFRTKAGMSCG